MIYSDLKNELDELIKHGNELNLYENECEKIMEKITESLLSGEKIEENFGLFCEYQMMTKIIKLTEYHNKNINIIIIKNLGILIPSIQDKKILFYFFSHDYMNQLILNISSSIEEPDNDFLSYYINFLKTIANKLDKSTLSLFFHRENNNFPLLDEASYFFNCQDVMIKNTSRNIFLSIIKLNYEPMIQYICDLPRITDLLLLTDSIKSYIILINNIKINNNNQYNTESRLKEIEESLIDDILFMQDILSVGIQKINYILINCLFSIPLQYLFNCILTHTNANVAFYILNLILKNIKNECINNLISFVLYSSQIHIKINENIASQESQEIYNILYLNKLVSHHSECQNLIFDEYIILVFSENFLKSIKHIKNETKTFEEIKYTANLLKKNISDNINDVSNALRIISEILQKNSKCQNIIKKMEAYHGLISRISGINIGISYNDANFSFLKIIYDNLLVYTNNSLKYNIYIQENIIKKECFYFIDCSSPIDNQYNYLNQLFLILQIINNNKISIELKKYLCLNKYLSLNEDNELKKSSSNSDEGTHNSDEPKDNIRKNKLYKNEIIDNNSMNSLNSINSIFNDNKSSINNKDNNLSILSEGSRNNRTKIIKDFFGLSETQSDYNSLFNNYTNSSFNEENNLSYKFLIPRPVNSNNDNIPDFDNTKQLIINKKIMKYEDMYFNNNYLNRLFFIYNSKYLDENNNSNIKSHEILLEKIINLIFINEKYLSKLNYRLSFELIQDLILGSSKCSFYEDKYTNLFNERYSKILYDINEILLKSNSTKTKIYKNAYQYFEECFDLNKKKSKIIMNECFNNKSLYLLLNIYKNKNINNLKIKEDNDYFDIIDFPKNENETIQCLFQILIGLYDLRLQIQFEKNNIENKDITKSKLLLRNNDFPLKFINSNQNIGDKINIKELKVNPTQITYKSKNINSSDYYMFNYQNYLFIVSPVKDHYENIDCYIIKHRLPLRQVVIYADRGDPRTLYLLNGKNDIETTLFFDGVSKASSMKENINNSIKVAILKEFSAVKSYINNLMEN